MKIHVTAVMLSLIAIASPCAHGNEAAGHAPPAIHHANQGPASIRALPTYPAEATWLAHSARLIERANERLRKVVDRNNAAPLMAYDGGEALAMPKTPDSAVGSVTAAPAIRETAATAPAGR